MLAGVLETMSMKLVTGLGVNGVAASSAFDDPDRSFCDGISLMNVRGACRELDAVFNAPRSKGVGDEGVVGP